MIRMAKQLPTQSETFSRFNVDVILCIEECMNCAQTCASATEASLDRGQWRCLRSCIRRNLDCADTCHTTAMLLGRHVEHDRTVIYGQLSACELACSACAAANEKHAHEYEHCRACAEACRRCEQFCRSLSRLTDCPPRRSRHVARV